MLPTPSTSHVSFATIYEPAEDSFLLLDTLSSVEECAYLTSRFSSSRAAPLVLELGTGSGVVIAFLAAHAREILGRDVLAMGVDVNEDACCATDVTVRKALMDQAAGTGWLGAVCASLFCANTVGEVDVLVFNPPYVPTAEVPAIPTKKHVMADRYVFESQLLELSYAGGADGMEITMRVLRALPAVLSPRGVAYILLCAQNNPEDVKKMIPAVLGPEWAVNTVGHSGKQAGWEKLVIIRIAREQSKS